MDPHRLNRIVKLFAARRSRRAALRGAGLAAAAALAARAGTVLARQATPEAVVVGSDPQWYAAVRRGRFAPGVSSEEVARIARESFVPLVSGVPGFVAYYVLDTGQGEHLTISIFSDPAGPAESDRRSAEWAPRALAGLIEGRPEVIAEGEIQVYAAADSSPASPEP